MNDDIKREIRGCFYRMFVSNVDLVEYIEGILYALESSKIISVYTYDRYDSLLYRYTCSQIISFSGRR